MITNADLIKLAHLKRFKIGTYDIVSQDPSVVSSQDKQRSATLFLPQFIQLWADLEKATGFAWKCTSYLRDSPTHQRGQAFDLAPDIASNSEQYYAVYKRSDPVLYKRATLIRALQSLRNNDYSNGQNKIGIFIEPDHLHVQVLSPQGGGDFPTNVIKWRVAKPIYPDTYDRMDLPMLP